LQISIEDESLKKMKKMKKMKKTLDDYSEIAKKHDELDYDESIYI